MLPELFAGRGAVVVYATSEPEEALLLGGETALMMKMAAWPSLAPPPISIRNPAS